MELIQQELKKLKAASLENYYEFLLGYCGSYRKRIRQGLATEDINSEFCIYFGNWVVYWIKEHYGFDNVVWVLWDDAIRQLAKDKKNERAWFLYLVELFFKEYEKKDFIEKVFSKELEK